MYPFVTVEYIVYNKYISYSGKSKFIYSNDGILTRRGQPLEQKIVQLHSLALSLSACAYW